MVPKMHAKRTHFKGTANYLLHDIRGKTADRVAWTEVRNVASRNPEVAWRVMAATSLDQDRLKQEAGVKNTGRKSKDHALHFSLAWHPDEAEKLDRQEMVRAANAILKVMGAEEHQALIVAHKDGVPHIHVLVNRVHPRDGRILSSSYEKLKASRWAEEYEKERGKIYCEQRVINNQARKRGEYTRGEKDEPRQVVDLKKATANDNDQQAELLAEHRRKAAALKQMERQQRERHLRARHLLESQHRERVAKLRQTALQQLTRSRSDIRERFRPRWEQRYHEQQAAQRAFEQQELRRLGRIQNALKSIDFGSLIGRKGSDDGRVKTISAAFQVISNAGARLEAFQHQQQVAEQALARQQRQEERAAAQLQQANLKRQLDENRRYFQEQHASQKLLQKLEAARLRAEWREKGRRLREQLERLRAPQHSDPQPGRDLSTEFQTAARGAPEQQGGQQGEAHAPPRPLPSATRPRDLTPQKGAEDAAKRIDEWKSLRAGRFDRDRDKNHDRDGDRER